MNADLKKSERADAHLSAPELRVLLFEDESQDGFHRAADHLENCPHCQSELTCSQAMPIRGLKRDHF